MSTAMKLALASLALATLFALVWFGADASGPRAASPPPSVAPSPTPSATPVPHDGVVKLQAEAPPSPDAGEAPAPSSPPPPPPPVGEDGALTGLRTRELTAQDRADLKLPERLWGGVVVTEVAPTSPAAEARLEPKDVIFRAQGAKILSMEDLQRAVGEREQTRIQVYRRGAPFEVVIQKPWKGGK